MGRTLGKIKWFRSRVYDNLADFIDERELTKLASNLIDSIHGDLESRSEWEKTYTDGLKYLGMKFDDSRSQPFQGSSGVIHPILAEAQLEPFSCYDPPINLMEPC